METTTDPSSDRPAFWVTLLERLKPYGIPLLLSSGLAVIAIVGILTRAGHPALPLDDSFIHLQFARRIAEGHPFTFVQGGGFSSGATSFLWPLMLAPFYLCGLHGLRFVYAAWFLGTLFHAGVMVESQRLTKRLAGRGAAIGVAAMCLFFGAFAWYAWSGMETMAFTWSLVRGIRVASEYAESKPEKRTTRRALGVATMGLVAPLLRPEGAFLTLCVVAVLLIAGADTDSEKPADRVLVRWPVLVALLGVAIVPVTNLIITGHARGATTIAKWYPGNPYFEGMRLVHAIEGQASLLVTSVLNGGDWTIEFLPEHMNLLLGAGLIALIVAAFRRKTRWRALLCLAFALATFIPCSSPLMLVNRVRYVWPFAPSWFVLIACLGAELGRVMSVLFKKMDAVPAVVAGVFAGALAMRLEGSLSDLASSARAIDQQQVKLGVWAYGFLPKDARIGLNDTGAIAYFSNRQTFDVVGLTTEGEAKYHVMGAGSQYEHFEKMDRSKLPTHFIVYPNWLGMNPVLGQELFSATVYEDASILGSATAVAYEANYDVLGRGDLPVVASKDGKLLDEVDVADLESELQHGYWVGPSNDQEDRVFSYLVGSENEVADGGRLARFYDGFVVKLPQGKPVRMVARLASDVATTLEVEVNGKKQEPIELSPSSWTEVELKLPADAIGDRTEIHVAPRDLTKRFSSLHYWFYESP